MEQQHDDKSKPADHIKPKLICIEDNKRQQPENDRPGSKQQYPDYPKSKACFLEKQQQRVKLRRPVGFCALLFGKKN